MLVTLKVTGGLKSTLHLILDCQTCWKRGAALEVPERKNCDYALAPAHPEGLVTLLRLRDKDRVKGSTTPPGVRSLTSLGRGGACTCCSASSLTSSWRKPGIKNLLNQAWIQRNVYNEHTSDLTRPLRGVKPQCMVGYLCRRQSDGSPLPSGRSESKDDDTHHWWNVWEPHCGVVRTRLITPGGRRPAPSGGSASESRAANTQIMKDNKEEERVHFAFALGHTDRRGPTEGAGQVKSRGLVLILKHRNSRHPERRRRQPSDKMRRLSWRTSRCQLNKPYRPIGSRPIGTEHVQLTWQAVCPGLKERDRSSVWEALLLLS